MRKRIFGMLLISNIVMFLMLNITVFAFSPRTTAPSGNYWYNSSYNPYYSSYTGECTWYTWGRAYEITGTRPTYSPTWGGGIYSACQSAGYSCGSTPKVGSIMCTSGHVAIVEAINGDTMTISEYNWRYTHGFSTETLSVSASTAGKYRGGQQIYGYVYLGNFDSNFFDFWGVDNNITISGTYKFWWKEVGYDNCRAKVYINGGYKKDILPDSGGFFSYELNTKDYNDGTYVVRAILTDNSGGQKIVERTVTIKNNLFFDFWGIDNNVAVSGNYKFWWKEIGYGNCTIKLYVDNKYIATIAPDNAGYFSYSLKTTQYSNGNHTMRAEIINISGTTRTESRTFNVQNNNEPKGYLDLASGENGVLRVIGWAVDEDLSSEPVTIHIYVGGSAGSGATCYNIGKANIQRTGLGWGDYHGYNTRVKVKERGQQNVYVYAINIGSGENPLIGSGTVNISNPYSVTYKSDNSQTQIDKQEKYSAFDLILSSTQPTRTGYTFKNWNTSADGSGKSYAPGATYSENANLTLCAQWTPNTYKVNFNANGGSVSSNTKNVTYNSAYGDLPTPTRNGYKFIGWFTSQSGGTQITKSTTVTTTSNLTLYAQWETTKIYTKSTVSKNNNTYTVKTNIYNTTSCEIIVAGYKNGRLVDLKVNPYSENSSAVLIGDIDKIKVMLWETLKNMKPLSETEVISVTQ